MLSEVEQVRLRISRATDAKKKSQYGQFFTSERTAAFMAGLFPRSKGTCHLLDAGAGIGSLSAAFLERWRSGELKFDHVELEAFEIDETLHEPLNETLRRFDRKSFTKRVRGDDFVLTASDWLSGTLFMSPPQFTHAILNPPYKKIGSSSAHRIALRRVGIETVNLYSAFVALAVSLLAPGGQIVAIVPRSFCNGPYYRPFREFVLNRCVIRHLHLFDSRDKAFKDDDVLQENVIVRLERGGRQQEVTVSTSGDDTFSDISTRKHSFDAIVEPNDSERFIHIPTCAPGTSETTGSPAFHHSLGDIGLSVSTGPVVDFRLRDHLVRMPEKGCVPLLYACHLTPTGTVWPLQDSKKPNAILRNDETEKWLYPNGFYCVVRRFSSKEEKRRIVARVVDPRSFKKTPALGFENHLNVFHENRNGVPEALAHGLAAYLNSTMVDESFRRFNGHTQVNATDLRQMKYLSRQDLIGLGKWAMKQGIPSQSAIDKKLGTLPA
ncbi:MAG: Eco57I restriction-modification methylase domain-containing protein [Planctomycetes bacterium]|nr:Eco57I restriction-modification methylase domain-containing protein [Planctomycetota bacterium]